ncbi:MAG: sigma-70 family RNA polymerase sigma factor [Acidobacteriota bacterium]
MTTPTEVTKLLLDWNRGDQAALDKLMPIVYQELRRLAMLRLRQERPDHTLQATALVNELYLQLTDWKNIDWKNRAHFFGVAAQLMRNILVDHARNRLAAKRGGDRKRLLIENLDALSPRQDIDLIALDDALTRLAAIDSQQSRIIELRYFGGLTIEETAVILNLSPATVKREWNLARTWLLRELSRT